MDARPDGLRRCAPWRRISEGVGAHRSMFHTGKAKELDCGAKFTSRFVFRRKKEFDEIFVDFEYSAYCLDLSKRGRSKTKVH